jgi:YVTN family beta-propeller protein
MRASNNHIYVLNRDSDNVSVIDSTSNTVVDTINVGDSPDELSLEYNPSNENIYVANENSGDVSIIVSSSNSMIDTIEVGMPVALEYNPSNNDIYAANLFRNTVSVIGTTAPPPPPPSTPAELIDKLISTIQNLDEDNVPQSVKTSLTAPLKEASDILNDDNPNNDRAVCGKLGAFINQVDANERRDTLTVDQADELRTQAENIRNNLDCQDRRSKQELDRLSFIFGVVLLQGSGTGEDTADTCKG